MTSHISTLEVRKSLGDILNRVSLRHDHFIIERKGKPLAALIPAMKWQIIQDLVKKDLKEFWEGLPAGGMTDDEAMSLALEAQAWARKQGKRGRNKAKR